MDEILPDDVEVNQSSTFKIYGGASFVNDEIVDVDMVNAKHQFDLYEGMMESEPTKSPAFFNIRKYISTKHMEKYHLLKSYNCNQQKVITLEFMDKI